MGKSGGARKGKQWRTPKAGHSAFQAPTKGLEDKVFTMGTVEAAATFDEVREQLARHIAQQSWAGAGRAGKAFDEMQWPPSTAPARPLLPMRAKDLATMAAVKPEPVETAGEEFRTPGPNRPAGAVPPPPPGPPPSASKKPTVPDGAILVDDDVYELAVFTYKMDAEDWKEEAKTFKLEQRQNAEADMRMYNLVLQHCTPAVEAALKGLSTWPEVKAKSDCMALLRLVRDLTYEHDETKQSTMSFVKSDFDLMSLVQSKNQTNEKFLAALESQVKQIDSHGGKAGYHPALFEQHLEALCEARGIELADIDKETSKAEELRETAMETSCEEYQACFLILASNDERYGGLKAELHNQHLIGDGRGTVYPTKLPAALQLLNSYKGGKLANQVPEESAGLSFVEQGNFEGKCWGCDGPHPLHKCPNYNKKERDEIYAAKKQAEANVAAKKKEKAAIAQANLVAKVRDMSRTCPRDSQMSPDLS